MSLWLRKRVTLANVAMALVLVFALSGGAYAAGKYVITSTKQISPKVLNTLKGKNGKAGAAGAAGPAGPAGPTGLTGSTGATGLQGSEGKEGKEGKTGPQGVTGFTETLPSEKTLSGDWSLVEKTSGPGFVATSVSFGIPLKQVPVPHYIRATGMEPVLNSKSEEEEVKSTVCTGSAADPTAKPGELCVYASSEAGAYKSSGTLLFPRMCAFGTGGICAGTAGPNSADRFGFGIATFAEGAGFVALTGSWAVTAE